MEQRLARAGGGLTESGNLNEHAFLAQQVETPCLGGILQVYRRHTYARDAQLQARQQRVVVAHRLSNR